LRERRFYPRRKGPTNCGRTLTRSLQRAEGNKRLGLRRKDEKLPSGEKRNNFGRWEKESRKRPAGRGIFAGRGFCISSQNVYSYFKKMVKLSGGTLPLQTSEILTGTQNVGEEIEPY